MLLTIPTAILITIAFLIALLVVLVLAIASGSPGGDDTEDGKTLPTQVKEEQEDIDNSSSH